jgi:hypothetical protein
MCLRQAVRAGNGDKQEPTEMVVLEVMLLAGQVVLQVIIYQAILM